jgi:glycosyltransferase involved in cell wall biosynthesis
LQLHLESLKLISSTKKAKLRRGYARALSPYENIWAATLISAMKHKKAVICTDVGYTRTFLKHGYHVILIPPKDPAALAEAITKLANDSELRRMLGENAHSFVKENLC